MSLVKKGLSDSKYYMLATAGNKVFGFLIIPILARSVGVEGFATYDLFLLISSIFHIFIILGIDSGIAILLAESKNDDTKLSFYYTFSLIISTSLLLCFSLIFGTVLIFVDELFLLDRAIWIYIVLYVLFNMINYHTFNFLRWREKAKNAAFINLFSYVLGNGLGIIFLYFNGEIVAYFQGLIFGLFMGSILSVYSAKEYIKNFKILDNSKELLKELLKISLPFVPNYLGGNLMQMMDRVVILMLFGKYELGLYAIIIKLAMIPQFIIGTITSGFLPVMINNYATEKGKKLIQTFFHLYIIVIPISFLLVYNISDWLVSIFAGDEYMIVAYLVPIAIMSKLFVHSTQANSFGYTISRKTYQIIYITFSSIFVNFIFSLSLGYFIGLEGIILGTLIGGIFRTYYHTKYAEKLYRFDFSVKLLAIISISSFLLAIFSLKGIV